MRSSTLSTRITAGVAVALLFVTAGVVAGVVSKPDTSQYQRCITTHSTWMAGSIISRGQGVMDGRPSAGEPLQAGITQKAFTSVLQSYPDNDAVRAWLDNSAWSVVPFLNSSADDVTDWPLDRLSNGNAMIKNGSGLYHDALDALWASLALQPRNNESGLWYWNSYPEWSYLDAMFSVGPFYAIYTFGRADFNDTCLLDTSALDDMLLQFKLLWQNCRDASTGLLVHGYDASKTATWANAATGASPIVWGRGLGWYVVGLVDTLDLLSSAAGSAALYRAPLLDMYQSLALGIVRYADGSTGGWYQVVDQGSREGNYIESSASALFSYALLKGARMGYFATDEDAAAARSAGRRAHQYITATFVHELANGTLGWNGSVAVCSLNSSATYDYYVGQPIESNSPLGAGAYVLASLEVERLKAQ